VASLFQSPDCLAHNSWPELYDRSFLFIVRFGNFEKQGGYRARQDEPIERLYGYDLSYRLGIFTPLTAVISVDAICKVIYQYSSFMLSSVLHAFPLLSKSGNSPLFCGCLVSRGYLLIVNLTSAYPILLCKMAIGFYWPLQRQGTNPTAKISRKCSV
jgi:hypothetical protein